MPILCVEVSRRDGPYDAHRLFAFHNLLRRPPIGAASERQGKKGKYLSVSFEDPSFAPGFYNLFKSGIEHGYTLTFERPRAAKKD